MRVCPTQAIRVRGDRAVISDDLCVDCGLCLSACPSGAIVATTPPFPDLSSFKYRVAVPSGALYSQFEPSIHPYIIRLAIERCGFDEVVDVAPFSAVLARVLARYVKEHRSHLPLISSYCPSTLRLIQVKYPELAELVTPLDTPRDVTAREIRRNFPSKLGIKPEEIGIFYISPCVAKMVSILHPPEDQRSWFDGVVSIRDFYPRVLPHVLALKEHFDETLVPGNFYFSAGWAVLGGITRAVRTENWLAVSGINQVARILDEIENSRLRHLEFVEALACGLGCNGGTLNVESPYVARANSLKQRAKYEGQIHLDDEIIAKHEDDGRYFSPRPTVPRPAKYFDEDVQTSLKKMKEVERIHQKLRQIDCGCCGAPTCMSFAEDCVRGEADLTDCIFFGQVAGPE
jgi:Fe-S-cluster-containing hydrogenase component 2